MGKELKVFENPEFGKVRAIEIDGEPYFVANEIAKCLGYVDCEQAVRKHCKYAKLLKGVDSTPFTTSRRGIRIIPEADMYALIFGSKLPKAEAFKDWVFTEVLPTIRKTGKYTVKQQPELTMEDLCREYLETCAKKRQLEADINRVTAEKQLAIAQRDEVSNTFGAGPDYYTVHEIPWYGKMFPKKDKKLNQQLGQLLSYITKRLGLEVKKCPEKEGVHWWRAYPAPAVEDLYFALIEDPSMLKAYRKKPRRRS